MIPDNYFKATPDKEAADERIKELVKIRDNFRKTFLTTIEGKATLGYLLSVTKYFEAGQTPEDQVRRNIGLHILECLGLFWEPNLKDFVDSLENIPILSIGSLKEENSDELI